MNWSSKTLLLVLAVFKPWSQNILWLNDFEDTCFLGCILAVWVTSDVIVETVEFAWCSLLLLIWCCRCRCHDAAAAADMISLIWCCHCHWHNDTVDNVADKRVSGITPVSYITNSLAGTWEWRLSSYRWASMSPISPSTRGENTQLESWAL